MLQAPIQAALAGHKYYQGKPCKYGHTGKRYLSTKACVDCYCISKSNFPPRHYEGRICKKCGATTRYIKTRNCVACQLSRGKI